LERFDDEMLDGMEGGSLEEEALALVG